MEKILIFDMDGVIVDSEAVNIDCEIAVLKKHGIQTDRASHYQYLGVSATDMWEELRSRHHLPLDSSVYIQETEQLKEAHFKQNGIQPIKGIHQLIEKLTKDGYRLGLASSSSKADIHHHLKAVNLHQAFEVTVSAEEVPRSKPAPDVFLRAAELLQVDPSHCMVIEDSTNGSRAAKAAGMSCIGFANPDYPLQDLRACDRIISSYEEF